jgi:hypothetical protein
VDLLVERGGSLFGIEVKSTATPAPYHAESLARWLKLTRGRASGVLACRAGETMSLRPGIRAVPWNLAW